MSFSRRHEEVLFDGYMIQLVRATVEIPDGSFVTREIVKHPGAVAIVALDQRDDTVILERQYRASLDTELLEIPAGKRDVAGESARDGARRELIEETGHDAATWVELGSFYNSAGFTDEMTTLFFATDLTEVGTALEGPEEEAMELVRVPLDDARSLIASGELTDGPSLLGLLLTLAHLGR